MDAERKRVVAVTGAGTFLGRNLIGVLEEDATIERIVAFESEAPPTAAKKTRVYDVDLTRPGAESRLAEAFSAERVDTVVHLAFLESPSHGAAYAHELESVGTMRVATACRSTRVRKLVQWSTTLLYGARPTNPNFLSEKHALSADRAEAFFADKIAAEDEANKLAQSRSTRVTILRTAPILGPTTRNFLSEYLARRFVPTMMGFDPLVQFIHEVDAIAAFKIAIERDVAGVFNIVGRGVLPLSTVIKLAGRIAWPMPHPIARRTQRLMWLAQATEVPAAFVDYLRFVCVADGELARRELGFVASYSTREAVSDYASAQRLRDVGLLNEPAASSVR